MKGNFDSVIHDIKPVVVDFHALWCMGNWYGDSRE